MKRRLTSILASVVLSVLLITPAANATHMNVSCSPNIGAKVPVILVHGFNSDTGALRSMSSSLDAVKGIYIDLFDYSKNHFDWITHPDIGPKLAATIDCYAQASRKNGGRGKVILVAHSMGGLAAEFATNQVVSGRKVSDEVPLAITLAAPYTGALPANAANDLAVSLCRAPVSMLSPLLASFVTKEQCSVNPALTGLAINSDDLKALPPFPPNVLVRAIAGNVTLRVPFFNTQVTVPTSSDLMVGVDSATARYTATHKGDGKHVVNCVGLNPFPIHADAPCEHNNMLNLNLVQQLVKEGVEEYLAAMRVPVTNFFGLGLQLGSNWQILGPKDDPDAGERRVVISKSCDPQRYRLYCEGFAVVRMTATELLPYQSGSQCNPSIYDDTGWGPPQVIRKITVDGVEGEYFTQKQCLGGSGGSDIMHGWRFPAKGVLVYDLLPYDSSHVERISFSRSVLLV